ncbi:hypothetical protein [Renibacterium salmoninarum]|uniref:hypothetical protein n=1 Tax=Renibacterium salmoninarum TaxID=1646 RepID=UPI0006745AA1|nr:hypothetical protein [Renibacterium salmoninarum]
MPQQSDSAAKSVVQVPPAARELLRAILVHGPTTRADLVSRLNLSAASLTRLGAPLLRQTLLVEGELISDGHVGRPL